MVEVALSQDLRASPEKVWELIGGFNAVPDFHPAIKASAFEEGGMVRCLTLLDGARLWERLLHFDAETRSYSYSIERFEGLKLPFRNYRSTLSLKGGPKPGTSTLHWSGAAEVAPGSSEADVEAFMRGIYEGGFKALVKRFGSP